MPGSTHLPLPRGYARIYELVDLRWVQLGQDIEDDQATLERGLGFSADGNRIVIGSRKHQDASTSAEPTGHARVFELRSGKWTQIGENLNGESDGDNFGICVTTCTYGFHNWFLKFVNEVRFNEFRTKVGTSFLRKFYQYR